MQIQKYKLKEIFEDFKVNEIPISTQSSNNGEFAIFWMRKKNYTTENALGTISKILGIPRKYIGCAGNKDSRAITTQRISIKNGKQENIEKIKLKDIELIYEGQSTEPINLGNLYGNKFEITIRNISIKPKKIRTMINYFGEQRFSKNNAAIGKLILKKKFRDAVELIKESSSKDMEIIDNYLQNQKDEFIGALKRLPWKNLLLYIHAYQSHLWNLCASQLYLNHPQLIESEEEILVPIIGFATELNDPLIKNIYEKIMNDEEIKFSDFIFRQIPELTSEGTTRQLKVNIENLEIADLEDDELNSGFKKCLVKFDLKKGCYATEAVKEMMK